MAKEAVLLLAAALWAVASAEILVNASSRMMANLPAIYDANITRLILRNNSITINAPDVDALRRYADLTELDLSYNLITQLPDGAFSSLSSLETLNLTGNRLRTIRNGTFSDLKRLRTLDLGSNPWNCTQELVALVRWMNDTGLQTGPNVTCATPKNLAGKHPLDVFRTSPTRLPAAASNTHTATKTAVSTVAAFTKTFMTVQRPRQPETGTRSSHNISSKNTLTDAGQNSKPGAANTWKFLTGIIVTILCTSMFIVCAAKSPVWYKMLFDYRHQRLRDAGDPAIFNTGRYSSFSLDTEQTETSAHELDGGLTGPLEDEDGFIEDGYIQPEDYRQQAGAGDV